MSSAGFENMVMGRPITVEAAINKLTSKGVKSVAINKDIALCHKANTFEVFYKKSAVGWIRPGTKTVKVPKETDAWIVSLYLQGLDWEID